MSLNGADLNAQNVPVWVQGEKLFYSQSGVQLDYESGSGYPGEGHNYYAATGILYLSNIRVVYVPNPIPQFFQNFNIPLEHLK